MSNKHQRPFSSSGESFLERPDAKDAAMTVCPQLWGIVLAGDDGQRLQAFVQERFGEERPKQYCAFFGADSLLRQTIRRAERLIPPERLLTVVTQHHLGYAEAELYDRPPGTVIVQPCNRDTGAGLLLPLMHVLQRDPEAIVALLPADHFITRDASFATAVEAAAAFVSRTPTRLILLGVEPSHPETGYDWIETGDEIGDAEGEILYQVRRFWEQPSATRARELYRQGALWNTRVVVGSARLLLALFRVLTPALMASFEPLRQILGTPEAVDILPAVYTESPAVNFSHAILAQSIHRLGVLPVHGIYWSTWEDPAWILQDLRRFGGEELREA